MTELAKLDSQLFMNSATRKLEVRHAINAFQDDNNHKPLCRLLEVFIHRKSRKKYSTSQKTIKRYHAALKHFLLWTKVNGYALTQVTADILEQYISFLSVRKSDDTRTIYARSSIDLIIVTVKTFYKALLWSTNISTDPTLEMIAPDIPRNPKRPFLQPDEIKSLIAALDHDNPAIEARDSAIIALGLQMMLRTNEILDLNLEDIDRHNARLTIHGKGGKVRTLPVPSDPMAAIELWLAHRDQLLNQRNHNALFINASNNKAGERLKYAGVYKLFKRLTTQIEVQQQKSVGGLHTLRRSGASAMYRNNQDLLLLQRTLGHASIETTQRYVNLDDSRLRDALEGLHQSLTRRTP